MDAMEAEALLRKLDRRMQEVEQILPTLPTREEMRAEIREAVAPLATKEQLTELQERLEAMAARAVTHEEFDRVVATLATKAELAAAIAPLATKAELAAAIAPLATKAELSSMRTELRVEIREEGRRTRQHFDAVAESMRDDVRLIAEGQEALREEVRQGFKRVDGRLNNHEKRITRLEASGARGRVRKNR